jgi:ATP-dependent exoDNAse (exonuclease V) beta subunit
MHESTLRQVKASAGSGKTFRLTARFLTLLGRAGGEAAFACAGGRSAGFAWPEILAVTFTNKAAAEMRERVLSALKRRALGLDAKGQAGDWTPVAAEAALVSILRRFHQLNIRTIDSLLSLLLRLCALELEFRPDFEVVFEDETLLAPLLDGFLARCEAGCQPERDLFERATAALIEHESRPGFWLGRAVRERFLDLVRRTGPAGPDFLADQQKLAALAAKALARFTAALDDLRRTADNLGLRLHANFGKYLAHNLALSAFEEPRESALVEKDSLRDCVLAASRDAVTPAAEAAYARLKQAHDRYRSEAAALSGAYSLAPGLAAARLLREDLRRLQAEKGLVLGEHVAGLVRGVLEKGGGVGDAFCRLGGRLHHLLVDEFQDTGRAQWDAIAPLAVECLAKGGSLFYVGDVKQAIYGWRGGDSALFDEVLRDPELAALAGPGRASETLPRNWRSAPAVVESNNAVFGRIAEPDVAEDLARALLPKAPPDIRAGLAQGLVAAFADAVQELPAERDGPAGYVRIERLSGGSAEVIAEEALAAFQRLLHDDLLTRRRPGEIAVLVRSHEHGRLVCDRLVAMNVPVVTESSLELARHPAVRQLAAFLAFLEYPPDDLAFLGFASGRELFLDAAGIDEELFWDWLAGADERPLSARFARDFPQAFERLIAPFLRRAGLMGPYDLAREAVRVFRVTERRPESELCVHRFLELIHLAEERGCRSLSSFLELWDRQGDKEKTPLPENLDAVRILTIHKAKGLEFPVVVVPFHHWTLRPSDAFAEVEFEGRRLLTVLRQALGRPYFERIEREVREELNLLYVAWTRACEELYGFFPARRSGRNPSPVLAGLDVLLGLSDERPVHEAGERPRPGDLTPPRAGSTDTARPAPWPEDGPVELMAWQPRLRVFRHLHGGSVGQRRGEAAHRAIELLRPGGDDRADALRAARLALGEFPGLAGQWPAWERELPAMLEWALGKAGLREALEHGRREAEILDQDGATHRVDLLAREADGFLAVEFKTGGRDPEHAAQVRRYLRLLAALEPKAQKPSGLLVYLDLRAAERVEL